jgi:hypothetical protein
MDPEDGEGDRGTRPLAAACTCRTARAAGEETAVAPRGAVRPRGHSLGRDLRPLASKTGYTGGAPNDLAALASTSAAAATMAGESTVGAQSGQYQSPSGTVVSAGDKQYMW